MAPEYFGLLFGILLTISQNMVNAKPIADNSMDICTWEVFKNHSRELNTLVMMLHTMSKHKSHPKVYIKEDKSISRIQCEHQCNPEKLLEDKKTCLKRIHKVLYSYENHITHVFGDQSISKDSDILSKINSMENHLRTIPDKVNPQIADTISSITKKMDKISKCLEQKGYKAENMDSASVTEPPLITSLLIEHTSYQLMSFTSLVARVFAVGDPSNHMLAQK